MPLYLILLSPILSAIFIYLIGEGKERRVSRISVGFSLMSLLSSVLLLINYLRKGSYEVFISDLFLFRVDALSVVMAITVSAISFIVHAYSVRYMQDDEGYSRFFALLDLITLSILVTVLAGNTILLLIGWSLIGVLLYFLLSHHVENEGSVKHSLWTLLIHRLGDLPLVAVVVILYKDFGTFRIDDLIRIFTGVPYDKAELIGVLIVLSAIAKSAQFPLHVWLPYTMGGPTPVSALMHAGIVNAGGFLINRFAFVYYQAEYGLHLAFWVGLVTALIGSAMMLMQTDIKRALGYSTVGQMGYMVMECGVGAFSLAIYHLITHGIFKATLFMGSGGVIHEARKDPNIPEEEVYRFFVKRELPPSKVPWIVFAIITVSVPLGIVITAHLVAGVDVFEYQGALVLLFFGWVTGAQTIFSIYKLGARNVFKLLLFVLISFSVVVLGYVVIGHSFEKFLYPDRELVERIYHHAGIDHTLFEILTALITASVVLGWIMVYYANNNRNVVANRFKSAYLSIYTHLSRELYINDLYSYLSDKVMGLSDRLNRIARWL